MVLFNHSTHELTAKIVYYGPGLCGKTTNLRVLHERLEKGTAGRLLSLATAQDRTIYFDLLPVELGNIKGYTVRFQLCTVPGQVFYNETRKLVLRGVDGIVFVVDSQWSMLSHDLESWQNLVENLRDLSIAIESLPVVIQYNKRDLAGVLSVDALQESLGFASYPFVEAVASTGQGVIETFKLVSKLTFVDLLRRLQRTGGFESDAFGAPPAGTPGTSSPGEETVARRSSAAKKTSFAGEKGAAAAAVAAPSDQPFEAGPGWIPTTDSDIFGVPAEAPPPAREPDLFEAPPAPAPPPDAVATESDVIEAPSTASAPAQPAPVPAPAPAPAPVPAAVDPELIATVARHDEALSALRAALEAQRAEASRLIEEARGALAAKGDHDALAAEVAAAKAAQAALAEGVASTKGAHEALAADVGAAKAALEALREELAKARSELGGELQAARSTLGESVEALASSLNERLSSVGADLFGARAEAEKAHAEGAEQRRLLAEKLESAEQELARVKAVTEEAHRHVDDRLAAAERRTRALAEAMRKALENLGE